jgi:transposase-like protein
VLLIQIGGKGYNDLVGFIHKKNFRIHYSKNEFSKGNSNVTRIVKFKGMDKKMFNLHLKECEFRFNNRDEDMYQNLLKIFRDETLKLS